MARPRTLAVIAVLMLASAGSGYYLSAYTGGAPTGEIAREVYGLASEADLEVLKVEDVGNLDRVVLSDGERVQETYVTEDGKYIVQNPIHVSNYTERTRARNAFISCLKGNNTRFFGVITRNRTLQRQLGQHVRMTQLQFQVLGGIDAAQSIFGGMGAGLSVTVQGREVPVRRLVLQNGIVWNFDGNVTVGLQTIPQIEQATGCRYDAG